VRIFFATEFYENGSTIQLISIGMVREDGRNYYAETYAARTLALGDPWLEKNVLPHLVGGDAIKARGDIAGEVHSFAGEKPEFWAYYADYDWVVLCQLYGRMIDIPKGRPMYCRDLKQEADRRGLRLPKQMTAEHNALADAAWARDAHLWLMQQPDLSL
jgi:hypothetical protein